MKKGLIKSFQDILLAKLNQGMPKPWNQIVGT